MKRDYYEVLAVAKDADDRTLKSAYRKLAMQYHPDRNPGNAEAEAKFKEAAEAYEVLSDAQKRQVYDRYGHDGLRGSAGGFQGAEDIFANFGDIFGDLFGMGGAGRSRSRSRARRGADLRYDLDLTFREAALGVKKTIDVEQHVPCDPCDGSGAKPGTSRETCRSCNGRGEVMHGQGMFIISTTCPSCQGEGSRIASPCEACRGRGVVPKSLGVVVDIPPGFDDGMSLRYTGKGQPGQLGGPPGDLYVVARIAPDELFKRDGDDLYVEVEIDMAQAALGDLVMVPTLEGDEEIPLKAGTQPGDHETLKKRGVANIRSGRRGNLNVVWKVTVPRELSGEQRRLLEQLHDSFSEKPLKKKRGLFS